MLWTAEVKAEIALWKETGVFPFPDLAIHPQPDPKEWKKFSAEKLRLIHHVAGISTKLKQPNVGALTIWARAIPV